MIEIIPISERNPDTDVDTEKKFYIDNSIANSMAKKYNYAIENIVLKNNDDNICFRHNDCRVITAPDVCDYKLSKLFDSHEVGVAGLIGTIALDSVCTWWNGVLRAGGRPAYASGFIIQGGFDKDGKPIEYPMREHPGTHDYLATVDGCCMFFPKWIFEEGLRFDEKLKGYHFYDTDICLQVLERGYKVSTTEILAKHFSEGKPPKEFDKLKKVFFEKWNKKVNGNWPISRLSKFNKA
jgi:hypothetical protein